MLNTQNLIKVVSLLSITHGHLYAKPNVIIIYADDVGWGDLSCYGAKKLTTPNLDKLASSGIRFTDGHCSAATCSPSRFSMLTGEHAFRSGINILPPNAPLSIDTETFTLPDLFKKAGYNTAVIGKWHLGLGSKNKKVDWNDQVKPGPLEIGFDYSFLLPSTNDRVPCVYLENHNVINLTSEDPLYVTVKPKDSKSTEYPDAKKNPKSMTYYRSTHGHNDSVINGIGRIGKMWGGKSALWNDEDMADVFIEKTSQYITQQAELNKPFFLYFASQDIHVPRAPHKRFQGTTQLGYRGDAMMQLDASVGSIMKILEDKGLKENTIVIFSSDNGPTYDDGYDDGSTVKTSTLESDNGHDGSGPYRGGKYLIYEGGTRVPFIVSWPAKLKPSVSDSALNQIDFLASFADFFEIPLAPNQGIDSRSHLSALLGEDTIVAPYLIEEAKNELAIRVGDWKYIKPINIKPNSVKAKSKKKKGKARNKLILKSELYNLAEDIGESNNIIATMPEKAKELEMLLNQVINAKEGIRSLK